MSGKHLALSGDSPMPDADVHWLNTTVSGSTKSLKNTDLSSLKKDFYLFRAREKKKKRRRYLLVNI